MKRMTTVTKTVVSTKPAQADELVGGTGPFDIPFIIDVLEASAPKKQALEEQEQ